MIIPRNYQEPIPNKVFTYMANTNQHPLVALPTGSGKTIVLCDIVHKTIMNWPSTKILVISHVKEILQQDYDALHRYFQQVDIDPQKLGVYSSGLKRKQIRQITVAGIQSIWRHPDLFEGFDFIIIDECHLIPITGNGMYRSFFKGLSDVKYFGLTATPYRLGHGYIYGDDEETIFDDLIYDLTSMENFNKLVDDGYLCKLKTSPTTTEMDVEGIHTKGGDFVEKEMSQRFDIDSITDAAVKELIKVGTDYKKWLIFAIDIDHAEHIAETLLRAGIRAMVVHSKMEMNRDDVIRGYKTGRYRAIVNVNVLTTGFDDPGIDLIALLRPTKSPVIHVQTIGRGLRISPEKDHCLILDFAGNTERLGPINDVHVHKKRKSTGDGEAITKRCPSCDTIHHPSVKVCEFCGHVFEFKTSLKSTTSSAEVVRTKKSSWLNVDKVSYKAHIGKAGIPMVQVNYHSGLRFFKEWICIEHPGYAGHKARHWLRFRGLDNVESVEEVLAHIDELKNPNRILVDASSKYPNIVDYSW